ncbi:MAG: FHA domain-containing protein [Planctomycetes bacterium]|nr:FHA domain-containing protein [Planctomycetota bacterium]
MALLKIETGQKAGTVVQLEGSKLVLGRGSKADVVLPDDGASRQHAEIFRAGGLHFIRDLGSRNGTFVNEQKISEVVLREGDQVRIGDSVLLFTEGKDVRRSRVLRVHEGLETLDTIRFRDTLAGGLPAAAPPEKRPSPKGLVRRVARIIAGELSVETVFEKVVAEVGQALGADRADLLLVERTHPDVSVRALATFDTKGEGEISVSRTILCEAIERHEAIVSSNASTDRRFMESASIVSHTIRSVVCVPIVVGGAVTALLYACNSQRPDAFHQEDLEAVSDVGLQLGALLGSLRVLEAREDVLRSGLVLAARLCGGPGAGKASERAAGFCKAIASSLNLAQAEVASAWVAGLLHGLRACGPAGADAAPGSEGRRRLVADLPRFGPILEAIECQDERHDGSGTPAGRVGDEIPLLGRILSLAKELDRLVREGGPEGKGLDVGQALVAIRESAGEKFHPDVVQACLVAHRNGALSPDASCLGPKPVSP